MTSKRPEVFTSFMHEVALIATVCLSQFLSQGGITMCLSTMNIILESFEDRSHSEIAPSLRVWFMSSFALTLGSFILISGRLGDLFGLKKIFVIGWIWTAVWSLINGLSVYSNSITFFIICRAFQGIGFALMLPCGIGILGTIYDTGNRKNIAFGIFGAMGPTGAVVGGLMAAVIAQLGWWPWCFWVLAIVSAACGVISYISIPHIEVSRHVDANVPKWKQFDYLGSFVGLAGLILLNFIWNQGPVAHWSAYIIVLTVISVLAIVAFFVIELHFVQYPLLPRAIFNYKIGLVLICVALGWGSFGIWQYYYWVIMLNYKKYSAIMGAVCFLPFFVLGVIAAMTCSVIIARTRPSYIICFSLLAFMSGTIMLSVTPIHQSYFQLIFGQMFILTWGMDLSFPAASIILSDCLPKHHQGMAGSLVSTVVNYSVALCIGIGSVVETEVMKRTGDSLYSLRCALHFGTGLAGLGVIFALLFVIIQNINHDMGTIMVSESSVDSKVDEKVDEKDIQT